MKKNNPYIRTDMNIMHQLRNSRIFKGMSVFMTVVFLLTLFPPTPAKALTGGPSQPEVQSFEPIGTSEMVDLFSGDFVYNIPIMDVGGYPINLSYHSGITMDQEASWVGLGWNINPGVINRNMRGLPDDFKGDDVSKEFNMKPNKTYGLTAGFQTEAFGFDALSMNYSLGITYNNYKGIGFEQTVGPEFSAAVGGKGEVSLGLSLTASDDGLSIAPSLSYSHKVKERDNNEVNPRMKSTLGVGINSRAGLSSMNMGVSRDVDKLVKRKEGDEGSWKESSVGGGSASISMVKNTYTPQLTMPFINTSVSFNVGFGASLFGLEGDLRLGGFYSEQRLEHTSESIDAYGYLFAHDGVARSDIMLDFNRENDRAFTHNTTNLPLTNFTYDVYSISGQGIGGMFRPFRGDVGYVYDPLVNNTSRSGDISLEIAPGGLAHIGGNVVVNKVESHSGRWRKDNPAAQHLHFSKNVVGDDFENVYFKQAGERNVERDTSLFYNIGKYEPVYIPITNGPGFKSKTLETFKNRNGNTYNFSAPLKRTERELRNQNISHLSKSEASKYGVERYTSSHAASHHLSEITTLRTDGARYVYGIPAYNTMQRDVTFNATGRSTSCSTGLVNYESGTSTPDNSLSNDRGTDNYFSSTELPPYAHSYLLTSVLSPDYVDADTILGPSAGDLGSYTKFNYDADSNSTGIQPAHSEYEWRVPYQQNYANYNEGLKTDAYDDKGSYIYGKKEMWYLQSIENKTTIAIFHTSVREDGLEAAGENGGKGTDAMHKLDSISLYSKPDYDANGLNATLIQRAHFEYDYSLCPSVPNNTGDAIDIYGNKPPAGSNPNINALSGKLTLKKVWFTYENSFKGKLSSYQFTYADRDHNGTVDNNPSYNLKGYDRWGCYKANTTTASCDYNDPISAPEYPYVNQNKTEADTLTMAWTLTDITLPSGGTIQVDYESDDYAYVQDKRANQMFKIYGIGEDKTTASQGYILYNENDGDNPQELIYVDLGETTTDGEFRENYFKEIFDNPGADSLMYFRFMVDMTASNEYEYVSGYAKVKSVGMTNNSQIGYIELETVDQGDNNNNQVHPISLAAWHYSRMHTPRLAYDLNDPSDTGISGVINALANASIIVSVIELFQGANGIMKNKKYGKDIIKAKSWVRLQNPNRKKLGGGCRVSKVTISDEWGSMTSHGVDADYGQEYFYDTEGDGTGYSSGVAAYEPMPGGDENPFRKPVFFSERRLLAPDDKHYMEEPFGESFFPSPSVGYGKVTVRNLQRVNGNGERIVKRHATGKVVNEFYTCKDFPTRVDDIPIKAIPKKTNVFGQILKLKVRDFMTTSQGYVVELNDMNGKQKAQWIYAEDQDTPISGAEYFYNLETNENEWPVSTTIPNANPAEMTRRNLDNTVVVIHKDESIEHTEVGVDYDFVVDFREQATDMKTVGTNGNLIVFLAAFIPIPVPAIFPKFNSQKTQFRSAVTTKVINRYGILRETVAHDLGSSVSTQNLAYDAMTGEVLLTKTKNDFNDEVYNFTYPAHWGYDRMGQASQNIRASVNVTIGANGAVTNTNDLLVMGDEVYTNTHKRAWVWDTNTADNTVYLMDSNGEPLTSTDGTRVTVIRSGRKNQHAVSIGSVTSLENPLKDTNADGLYDDLVFNAATEILNASAVEYDEDWNLFCNEQARFHSGCSCTEHTQLLDDMDDLIEQGIDNNVATRTRLISSPYRGSVLEDSIDAYIVDLGASPAGQVHFWTPVSYDNSEFIVAIGDELDYYCEFLFEAENGNLPSGYKWWYLDSVDNLTPLYPEPCVAGDVYSYTCNGYFSIPVDQGADTSITLTVTTCIPIATCTTGNPVCDTLLGDTLNPYLAGIRGNWRPKRSFAHLVDRVQTFATNNNTDIRRDGYYKTFDPFWDSNSGDDWTIDSTNWTWATEATEFSPYGFELENKDALGRRSGALYGYNHRLPTAVASNTTYNQIAYDGFEDYDFAAIGECCNSHFDYMDYSYKRTTNESHTGRYSIQLEADSTITATRELTDAAPSSGADDVPYTVKADDIIGTFSPPTYPGDDKEYVLSYWVKVENANNDSIFDYTDDPDVTIKANAVALTKTNEQRSSIIDGWQRVEYRFTITSGTSGDFDLEFDNNGSNTAYIDDIRIHPFNSTMKSFVYDPITLRLWSELDERNFATFYEYDEEGRLLRTKKETERGIVTIQESRGGSVIQNP